MTNAARRRVYADYNATAPLLPEVLAAMHDALRSTHGNAGSIHAEGAAALYAVEKARRTLRKIINAQESSSLIFTSGGTESNNLALRGVVEADLLSRGSLSQGARPHVIVSAAEHKAVLEPAQNLSRIYNAEVTILPVDENSRVRAEDLLAHLRPETILVSIIFANNEVGSINDIPSLAKLVHSKSRALLHTDALQALGRIPINVEQLGVDLMSLGAHKCGGPKGVGALYIRAGVNLHPSISGGEQEAGLRAGTQNTPSIVGFAEAAKTATENLAREHHRLSKLRDELWNEVRVGQPQSIRNTPTTDTLPNTLNFSVPGVDSRSMVAKFDELGIACSSGSACTTNDPEPSHVLLAMNKSHLAGSALRFSFGSQTEPSDVDAIVEALRRLQLPKVVTK